MPDQVGTGNQTAPLSIRYHVLELVGAHERPDVDERTCRTGDRNLFDDLNFIGRKCARAVDTDSRSPPLSAPRNAHLDLVVREPVGHRPHPSGTPVADHGAMSARKDSGHLTREWRPCRVTEEIDARVERMEQASVEASVNSSPTQPQREQLLPRYHSVLSRARRAISPSMPRFVISGMTNPALGGNAPVRAGDSAPVLRYVSGWSGRTKNTATTRPARAIAAITRKLVCTPSTKDSATMLRSCRRRSPAAARGPRRPRPSRRGRRAGRPSGGP